MDDTLAEVDLDEWNNAFVGAMTKQLTTLYTEKDVKGKDEAFKIITKVKITQTIFLQLNQYETAPYFLQLGKNLTLDCLLIYLNLPEFPSSCMMWS